MAAKPASSSSSSSSYTGHPAVDHALAGIGAGLVTTLCLHPLDLVKTRLQGVLHLIDLLIARDCDLLVPIYVPARVHQNFWCEISIDILRSYFSCVISFLCWLMIDCGMIVL